jgi:hypothetical protein
MSANIESTLFVIVPLAVGHALQLVDTHKHSAV